MHRPIWVTRELSLTENRDPTERVSNWYSSPNPINLWPWPLISWYLWPWPMYSFKWSRSKVTLFKSLTKNRWTDADDCTASRANAIGNKTKPKFQLCPPLFNQSINQSIVVYYRHDKMQANNIIKWRMVRRTRPNKCSYITGISQGYQLEMKILNQPGVLVPVSTDDRQLLPPLEPKFVHRVASKHLKTKFSR